MDTLLCPRCHAGVLDAAQAADGITLCTGCGHPAAAALVTEQLLLQQQQEVLTARLDWVRGQVLAGAQPRPAGPDGTPDTPPEAGGPGAPRPGRPVVQGLLLGTGAVLLVIAAMVFVAVAWDLLGAAGQLTCLLLVTALLATGAHLARTSFPGTAQTLAAVAACMTLIALLSAPSLGLGPSWGHDHPVTWTALAFAVTAALCLVQALVSQLSAWHLGATLATVAAACFGTLALGGGGGVPAYAPVLLAVAGTLALGPTLPRSAGPTRELPRDLRRTGTGLAGLAVVEALTGYTHLDRAAGWGLTWLALASCAAALTRCAGSWQPPHRLRTRLAPLAAGAAAGQALVLFARSSPMPARIALPLLALAGAAALATTLRPALLLPGLGAAGAIGLLSLPVMATGDGVTRPVAAGYLGLACLAGYLLSLTPRRSPAAWPAAACGTGAAWLMLSVTDVDTAEVYTAAAAALLLLSGLIRRRDVPASGSVTTLGPALAMALLPSALIAFGQAAFDQDPLRAVLVIAAGAGLAVAGAAFGIRAAFLVGIAAALLAGSGQVFTLVGLVPRWVALGGGGALLVAGGFAAEGISRAGRRLRTFTGGLA
ncbi:MAG TPA: hypothetical protein VFP72_20370 [Kineosporiaceae bacterium]|nr:hypothetical protein [Kineosporiaceae bacterium]